jgi:hypothetical protein
MTNVALGSVTRVARRRLHTLLVVAGLPCAVMLSAVAVVSRRTRVFPTWMTWLPLMLMADGLVVDGRRHPMADHHRAPGHDPVVS